MDLNHRRECNKCYYVLFNVTPKKGTVPMVFATLNNNIMVLLVSMYTVSGTIL